MIWDFFRTDSPQYEELTVTIGGKPVTFLTTAADKRRLNDYLLFERQKLAGGLTELQKRSDLLAARENALQVWETELKRRETALAAERSDDRKRLQEGMTGLHGGVSDLQRTMRELTGRVSALQREVTGSCYEEGFRTLARLHRTALGQNDTHTAARLEQALRSFGLVKIEPAPGSPFDRNEQDPVTAPSPGSVPLRIRCCRACGWKLNDAVILPAAVEPEVQQ